MSDQRATHNYVASIQAATTSGLKSLIERFRNDRPIAILPVQLFRCVRNPRATGRIMSNRFDVLHKLKRALFVGQQERVLVRFS